MISTFSKDPIRLTQSPLPTAKKPDRVPLAEPPIVFNVLEFWYAEDVGASKGDGFQHVATLFTRDEANAYAKAYKDRVMRKARTEAKNSGAKNVDSYVTCKETTKKDGTMNITVDWGHRTEIVVKECRVFSDAEAGAGAVPFPEAIESATGRS